MLQQPVVETLPWEIFLGRTYFTNRTSWVGTDVAICVTNPEDRMGEDIGLDHIGYVAPELFTAVDGMACMWCSSSDEYTFPMVNAQHDNEKVRCRLQNAQVFHHHQWTLLPKWNLFGKTKLNSIMALCITWVPNNVIQIIVRVNDTLVSGFLKTDHGITLMCKLLHKKVLFCGRNAAMLIFRG